MSKCPNCGSTNTYIHDKGFRYFIRRVGLNSRMVCKECRTTWKRRHPDQFSKLKHKSRRHKASSSITYKMVNGIEIINIIEPNEISSLVGQWQERGEIFICLNLKNLEELSTQQLGNLMDLYRRIRAIGGDLIVNEVSFKISDYLWSLNLGYFISKDQKIIT